MITFSYYPGCSLKTSSSFYENSLKKVFSFYGVSLKEIDDWSCCGASAASTINNDVANLLSARNIAIAERDGHHVLAPCSVCYAQIKTVATKVEHDKKTRETVNNILFPLSCTGSVEVKNVLDVFLEHVSIESIADSPVYDLSAVCAAPYYGCLLPRIENSLSKSDTEDPTGMDKILSALGAIPTTWQYKTECCGAAATITNKRKTAKLSERIMSMAIAAGANAIVTTCPLCQLNLDILPHLVNGTTFVPVFFLTELFELALFGTIDGVKGHLIPVDDILKSISTTGDDVA